MLWDTLGNTLDMLAIESLEVGEMSSPDYKGDFCLERLLDTGSGERWSML
jgi:hypothetical protein